MAAKLSSVERILAGIDFTCDDAASTKLSVQTHFLSQAEHSQVYKKLPTAHKVKFELFELTNKFASLHIIVPPILICIHGLVRIWQKLA